jgi:hypothetical protein
MRPVARLVVASVAANILLIVLIGLMIPTIGEFIESEFFPHSGPRTIVEKRRGTERFCWEQEFAKWRTGTARIWNYHLSDDHVPPNVESFTPWRAVGTTGFDNPDGLQTGDPPKSNEETPLGLNRTSFCMDLPTWVQPATPFTITGRLGFDGIKLFGRPLWMVYIDMPPIVCKGTPTC